MRTSSLITTIKRNFGHDGSPKVMISTAIAALILVALVNFFALYTIVKVDVGPEVKVESLTSMPLNYGSLNHLGNLYFVRRGTESLRLTQGTSETIVNAASFDRFGYAAVEASLAALSDGRKLSSGGSLCPVVTTTGYFSYNCDLPDGFSQYRQDVNGIPRHTAVASFAGRYASTQYKDGIITWGDKAGDRLIKSAVLRYQSPGQTNPPTIEVPSVIRQSNNYIELFVDNTGGNSDSFAVYDYNVGVGYYYASFSPTVQPVEFKRAYKFDTNNDISACALADATLSCYHGPPPRHGHDEGEEDGEHEAPLINPERSGVIETYQLSGNQAATKTYQTASNERFSQLYALPGGQLFGFREPDLRQIELGGNDFASRLIYGDVQQTAAGRLMYFTTYGRLYAYDPSSQASQLLATDQGEDTAKIIAYGDRLLKLSYNRKDPAQLLNAYIMSGDSAGQ